MEPIWPIQAESTASALLHSRQAYHDSPGVCCFVDAELVYISKLQPSQRPGFLR
jgi:hypothetical protein